MENMLKNKVRALFPSSKIAALIGCGLKPKQIFAYINYGGVTPEQFATLLPDEESITSFIEFNYSTDYITVPAVFDIVFDMIPDDQLEKYVSMLSIDTYLSNYKYLQSRGIKMTAERGNEAVEAIPRMDKRDDLDVYFGVLDDLSDLRMQGALKDSSFQTSNITKMLLKKRYADSWFDNMDVAKRHCDGKLFKNAVSLLLSEDVSSEAILRNSEKLFEVSGGS